MEILILFLLLGGAWLTYMVTQQPENLLIILKWICIGFIYIGFGGFVIWLDLFIIGVLK